jgi:mRNA-degrading endonuclease RelE of RelBE toxin-antitoxin system
MAEIEWTRPAFSNLERLPQVIAFEIVRRVDLLADFPESGASLQSESPLLKPCRQLIIKRKYRVVYEFDEFENTIYVLAVQNCRQKLPSARDLKRQMPTGDD